MPKLSFKITAATNVGLVRSNNEDNFIICTNLSEGQWFVPDDADAIHNLSEAGAFLCVADGMGGMNAGEIASEIAVNSLKNSFSEDLSIISSTDDDASRIAKFMKKVVVSADKEIKDRAKSNSEISGMGSTVVAAWIKSTFINVVWCGDSRAYLYNPASGMKRLTKDHSFVQQLIDNGSLDEETAFYHPDSNIITRSLGDSPVKAQPDYVCHNLSKGDIILLCSDGLCGLIQDNEIQSILMQEKDCLERCKSVLIDAALAAGGHDNVTVALFQCTDIDTEDIKKTNPNICHRKRSFFWWRR